MSSSSPSYSLYHENDQTISYVLRNQPTKIVTIHKIDPVAERQRLDDATEMREWGFSSTQCGLCHQRNSDLDGHLIQCARCKVAHYCSLLCMNRDQPNHAQVCLQWKAEKIAADEQEYLDRRTWTSLASKRLEKKDAVVVVSGAGAGADGAAAGAAGANQDNNDTDTRGTATIQPVCAFSGKNAPLRAASLDSIMDGTTSATSGAAGATAGATSASSSPRRPIKMLLDPMSPLRAAQKMESFDQKTFKKKSSSSS